MISAWSYTTIKILSNITASTVAWNGVGIVPFYLYWDTTVYYRQGAYIQKICKHQRVCLNDAYGKFQLDAPGRHYPPNSKATLQILKYTTEALSNMLL